MATCMGSAGPSAFRIGNVKLVLMGTRAVRYAAIAVLVMLFGCKDDGSTNGARAELPTVPKTSEVVVCGPNPEHLFKQLCVSCHALAGSTGTEYVGLPVRGLWGTRVAQTDGRSVLVDEEFIRQSLFEPQAMITSGCVPVMPTFKGQLEENHVQSFVALYRANADAAPVGSR